MSHEVPNDDSQALTTGESWSTNEAFIRLIKNIYERDFSKYSARIRLQGPFDVDKEGLEVLKESAVETLNALSPKGDLAFIGVVGFSNGKEEKYDDFDLLIKVSSNNDIPAMLHLQWDRFIVDDQAHPIAGTVIFRFVTERWRSDEFSMVLGQQSFLEISITSSNERWARATFTELSPLLRPMQFHWILSWYRTIEDRFLIDIGLGILGALCLSALVYSLNPAWFEYPHEEYVRHKQEVVEAILKLQSVDQKINALSRELLLGEEKPVPWAIPSMIGFFLLVSFGMGKKAINVVFPKSAIILGASGKLLAKNRTFSRSVWSLVLIPLAVALVTGILVAMIF